ncbi:uncharacterized protein LOC124885716 [Capsicum annuum]|uniref:uncharacterized protein LOC124885716 n=1 Tax=Capsicum annuum TaxID=4072 RepID=UPI001FB0D9C3|nr:uncharacterized protein LOC124885716 [Capsicum annuum]
MPESQIKKSKRPCFVCGKLGHRVFQCYLRKGQKPKQGGQDDVQARLTEGDEVVSAVIVEANLVANKTDWVLDTGASRHFCANKELFHDFDESTDGECVYIGNSTTAGVMGKGKILLKLTSGKTLALNNVLYVPSLRRNLVFGALLNKVGLKLVLEADKIIISYGGDFFGKGYLNGGLFVLNIDQEIFNANISNSTYIAESINLWHEAKHAKKPFKYVTSRKTGLLELVHSDLADFKKTINKGAISWKSSKQTYIARSIMESEFVVLKLAGQEAEWLRNLLTDVPLWERQMSLVSLHCDSQTTIGIVKIVYTMVKRDIFTSDMVQINNY